MIPVLIRSFPCSADVAGNRIVKFSDVNASMKVAAGAAATDPLIGISDAMGGLNGGLVDVTLLGTANLKLGGTVAAGDPITSDANGAGVKLIGASGASRRVIAWAQEPGVSGDVIEVLVERSIVQLP